MSRKIKGRQMGTLRPWMVVKLGSDRFQRFERKTDAKDWIAWRQGKYPDEEYVLAKVSGSLYFGAAKRLTEVRGG